MDESVGFNEAKQLCEAESVRLFGCPGYIGLPSPRSGEENECAAAAAAGKIGIWLGFTKEHDRTSWRDYLPPARWSLEKGWSMTYSAWATDQPNGNISNSKGDEFNFGQLRRPGFSLTKGGPPKDEGRVLARPVEEDMYSCPHCVLYLGAACPYCPHGDAALEFEWPENYMALVPAELQYWTRAIGPGWHDTLNVTGLYAVCQTRYC